VQRAEQPVQRCGPRAAELDRLGVRGERHKYELLRLRGRELHQRHAYLHVRGTQPPELESSACASLCTPWPKRPFVCSALSSKGLNGTLPAALGNVTALTALCVLAWRSQPSVV
jgi:hypothetical protein